MIIDDPFSLVILVIGFVCTGIDTLANCPLVWKVHKSNDTISLSQSTLIIAFTSCIIWIVYGVLIITRGVVQGIHANEWLVATLPGLFTGVICSIQLLYLIIKKWKNRDKERKVTAPTAGDVSV